MIGVRVSVWVGAFSDYWRNDSARPGDGWVAATVLETGDDGAVKVERDGNADHTCWVKADHWKEFVDDA
jgi:hypothetical protein